MTAPRIIMQLVDPGAVAQPVSSDQIPIYVGVAASGATYEVLEFSRESDAEAELTHGHLLDVTRLALACGAPSVKCVRIAATVAGVITFQTDDDLLVDSITGDALQFLEIRIEIVSGGAGAISTGTRKAKYTLDNFGIPSIDAQYTEEFTIPASGQISLQGTGLVVNLDTAQVPTVGDATTISCQPGHYTATEVALVTPALRTPQAGQFTFAVYTGDVAGASAANTLAAAVESQINTLFSEARFIGAMAGASLDTDSNVITAFAAAAADPPFLSIGYGAAYATSPIALPGRAILALREHEVAAIRASLSLISTDLGRTASKALAQVVRAGYDQALEGSALHDNRISTLKTWTPSAEGVFITQQRLLSASISNFTTWPHAAVMITALRSAHRVGFLLILDSLRRTATGTMDPRDAKDIEAAINAELVRVLLDPLNARGTRGHASAVGCGVDLATILPSVGIDVRVRPLGYVKDLTMRLQYSDVVP